MDIPIKSSRHKKAIQYASSQIKLSPLSRYVNKLYLFGSCARGEEKYKSDVDLFLVLSEDCRQKPELKEYVFYLKGNISPVKLNDPEVDLKVVVGDAWEKSKMLFYKNVRKDGINIWD